ncbi:MAG: hypothetical protein JW918_11030, partial [Anaerolineae bacterium]|nr:hypothetical protein [Anaerolineae bacterium]
PRLPPLFVAKGNCEAGLSSYTTAKIFGTRISRINTDGDFFSIRENPRSSVSKEIRLRQEAAL